MSIYIVVVSIALFTVGCIFYFTWKPPATNDQQQPPSNNDRPTLVLSIVLIGLIGLNLFQHYWDTRNVNDNKSTMEPLLAVSHSKSQIVSDESRIQIIAFPSSSQAIERQNLNQLQQALLNNKEFATCYKLCSFQEKLSPTNMEDQQNSKQAILESKYPRILQAMATSLPEKAVIWIKNSQVTLVQLENAISGKRISLQKADNHLSKAPSIYIYHSAAINSQSHDILMFLYLHYHLSIIYQSQGYMFSYIHPLRSMAVSVGCQKDNSGINNTSFEPNRYNSTLICILTAIGNQAVETQTKISYSQVRHCFNSEVSLSDSRIILDNGWIYLGSDSRNSTTNQKDL